VPDVDEQPAPVTFDATLPPVPAVEPDVEALDAPAIAPRPSSRALRLAVVAAVVFFLVAVAMTVVAASVNSRLSGDRGDRQAVPRVAGQLTQALLGYDYRTMDTTEQEITSLATGGFLTQIKQDFPALKQQIAALKAKAEVTVKHIYVGDIEKDTASSLVEVDQVVTTPDNGPQVQPTIYLQIDLVKVGGSWKVDSVTNVNLAVLGSSAGALGDSSTTSTTPPAPTTSAN
jgi:hypothetical protein